MSTKILTIGLSAASNAAAEIAEALSSVAAGFVVEVANRMPRHISLPELGLFLLDVNAAEGNKGRAKVASKDALLRCVASIEAIAQLNGYADECMRLDFYDAADADATADEVTQPESPAPAENPDATGDAGGQPGEAPVPASASAEANAGDDTAAEAAAAAAEAEAAAAAATVRKAKK